MPGSVLGIACAPPCAWQMHYGGLLPTLQRVETLALPHVCRVLRDLSVFESLSAALGLWLNWVATQSVCAAAAPTSHGVSSQPPLSSSVTLASHLSNLSGL